MNQSLVPIALFFMLAFVTVRVTSIVSVGRTRRRLIESGASPELARALLASPTGDSAVHESLRWGLMIAAVGVALIIVQFLPYQHDEPIALGVILLFGAGGMLAYYATGRRAAKEGGESIAG